MSNGLVSRNPVAFAVVCSMVVIATIVSIAIAIGGSYALTVHAIAIQQKEQKFLQYRAAGAQVRTGIPTCQALIHMDNASKGLMFARPKQAGIFKSEVYSARLAKAIHAVVIDTHCSDMIKWAKEGVPYPEIARRLERLR